MDRGQPRARRNQMIQDAGSARDVNESARRLRAGYFDRESARARSARSSVEIGQCASQLMQYASISAPDLRSSASSSRAYPVSLRS